VKRASKSRFAAGTTVKKSVHFCFDNKPLPFLTKINLISISGAHVFPGGVVENSDFDENWSLLLKTTTSNSPSQTEKFDV
jgi:hypothetical protein